MARISQLSWAVLLNEKPSVRMGDSSSEHGANHVSTGIIQTGLVNKILPSTHVF